MKHVIVIETVDEIAGGFPLRDSQQEVLIRACELFFEMENKEAFVHAIFNQKSAIDAVHEMYNVPREGIEI